MATETQKPKGLFGRLIDAFKKPDPNKGVDDRPVIKKTTIPGGKRSSSPSNGNGNSLLTNLGEEYRTVNHQFLVELIPIIRHLCMYNADVSQALSNVVTLGNTGHKIKFDKGVTPEQQDKMRNHLMNKRKNWAPGTAGINGLVNKLLAQLMIGGAVSGEWVVNNDLTGIQNCLLVNPEEIYFVLDRANVNYTAYQKPSDGVFNAKDSTGMVKLNPNTYKYFALNGDTEVPYGVPPYLPVIRKVKTQGTMDENIEFVINQMGLIGFLECLIDKPDQNVGQESDENYDARLEALLSAAKQRILAGGLKDGIVVGFKEDHEFKFNSASNSYEGVNSLYEGNELQMASALKTDAALWGRGYATSETQISVVFMKMLSELKNWQLPVKEMLEFGYALELRLAGFQFDYLEVVFKPSTIQDDLKFQQAQEIKLRNVLAKYCAGIISIETAADELDYDTPDQLKPRVPVELLMGKSGPGAAAGDGEKKKTRKDQKNKSKKKSREKRSAS